MPLIHSSSEPAFKTNVKTLMGEIGKSPHVKNRAQALAVAYSVKRRGRAFGGFSPYPVKPSTNRMEHAEARNMMHSPAVHTGPVLSTVGGRTDHHPTNVPAGSYIFTADHVSSLGQGNTLAGMKHLNSMFKMGPYDEKPMAIKHGAGPPRPPRLQHADGGASDKGGARGHGIGHPTPVAIAGGEFGVPPEKILQWLHEHGFPPDLKFGHAALDAWMTAQRKDHIKTLKKLPGPAKS